MNKATYQTLIANLRDKIYLEKPLVHHITNFVTTYQCARITSFLGASPIMAFSKDEVVDIVSKSQVLVVNIGTLNDQFIASIPLAMAEANRLNIPIVIDPVGINASNYRYQFVKELLEMFKVDIIRCNQIELCNLHGLTYKGKGIDGNSDTFDPKILNQVAQKYQCTIACTGAIDLVGDSQQLITLDYGSSLLPRLVGTGCMTNSLIGSYLSVADVPSDAAVAGILTMCLAAEQAERILKTSNDLGTFEVELLNCISNPKCIL